MEHPAELQAGPDAAVSGYPASGFFAALIMHRQAKPWEKRTATRSVIKPPPEPPSPEDDDEDDATPPPQQSWGGLTNYARGGGDAPGDKLRRIAEYAAVKPKIAMAPPPPRPRAKRAPRAPEPADDEWSIRDVISMLAGEFE